VNFSHTESSPDWAKIMEDTERNVFKPLTKNASLYSDFTKLTIVQQHYLVISLTEFNPNLSRHAKSKCTD